MNVEEIIKTTKKMPLETRTLIHITLIHNKIYEHVGNALKPFEVSLQQFNVLRILRGQKGKPANLSTLNERMVTKMSNTTRLVDKLLAKGYVDRCVCPSNRRKVEILITESGSQALTQMDKVVAETENEIVQHFSKQELEQLNLLLDKF
ncbi:MarR family transcriptional regulator [Flagellimonas alvinocaridis]|uniref:MarR family transcriptional regulator n=1 Tax=Flagellimonas alvinocaridis TaxID=2530200 RepID=A0A4V4HWZ7_9FLAO|nr:MarR family transcriptional regulator [Allomuricauda alvinocaridis]THV59096.1 MarR family transcriptional regulator [Allomuricauda alvinocaridis]